MDEPTIDMWRALIAFRARHGRYWKQALSLAWMTGADGHEPYPASLRAVRNQLGPSWLYRLKPAVLDAQACRIARLDSLPVRCAALHPETGEPILLKRGEIGYGPLPTDMTVEQFNRASGVTAAQLAAMFASSLLGSGSLPRADPPLHEPDGQQRDVSERLTGEQGGEGVG